MKPRLTVSLVFVLIIAGCATPLTPRESGTLTGAGIGAATGAILGGIAGAPGEGAAIGAAFGAITGALAGEAIQAEQAARAYPPGYAYGPPPYPYYPQPPMQAPSPNAALRFEVSPEETEILVDGRRVGVAREFGGPSVVPVASGLHILEFRWEGFSVIGQVMVPPGATVPVRRDLRPPSSAFPKQS